jgi:transposase
VLVWKQMQRGGFVWPPVADGVVRLSAAQFAALFDGLDWSRLATARGIHTPSAAA